MFAAGLAYMVTGSMAVNYYAVPRMTRDIDVDFIVRRDSEYRLVEFSRRRHVSVEGCDLYMVAPEDLILSKLDWARASLSALQLADVRNLLTSIPELDHAYLARWASRLGLEALYREVSR
jgi:hypothetical protein